MLAPGLGRRNEMACVEACGVIEITGGMESAQRMQSFFAQGRFAAAGTGPDRCEGGVYGLVRSISVGRHVCVTSDLCATCAIGCARS